MASPAILFLDEADALAPGRGDGGGGDEGGGGPDAAMRLLAALLTEMDGLEASPGE
jgi:SpoVK/Ycf46/Vps4 family AAA+-type ATPase